MSPMHDWVRRAERPLTRPEKLVLSAVVARTYLEVRRALRSEDVKAVVARLRARRASAAPAEPLVVATRLSRATVRVLRFLPGDTRCLSSSLVLTALLSRAGIDSSLVIGVKPGDAFGAHAWVEVGPHALLPPGEDSFPRLVTL